MADQDVLRLHVSVDHAVGVQVVQRGDQLLRDWPDHLFGQRLVFLEDLEQLALRVLRDQAELGLGLERVQQQHDVLVAQALQDLDLLSQVRDLLLGLAPGHSGLLLLQEFQRHDLPRVQSAPLEHFAERALADGMQDRVVVHGCPKFKN